MGRNPLRSSARGVRWGVLAVALFLGCDDGGEPRDGGGDEDSYVRCDETMCTAGNAICCSRDSAPGTWDPVRLGCICPGGPDADADGDADADADGDVTPDVEPEVDTDAEPDVPSDVEAEAEPDSVPDVAPDVEPDTETLDSLAE